MKTGVISLDFRRWPLERCFASAARCGYDGVEIWGGRPHAWPFDMDGPAVAQVLELKKRYGLDVPMYTPAALGMGLCLCSASPIEREDALNHYRRAIEVAAKIGAPMVLVVVDHPGYQADARESWRLLVDATVNLADFAADKGVTLCFEPLTPLESPVLTTADDCAALIADAGRPNVRAMLDIVPPTVMCEPVSAYFEKLDGGPAYVHICNTDGVTDAHRQLDDGVLSVPDILRVLSDNDYDGYVTVELYSVSARDPEATIAGAMRLLSGWHVKVPNPPPEMWPS